ncbi:MAG: 5-carboxymethyl-2-hydroxymuconate isomerase [Parasphingorhabdus sp.]|jgi:5-carboxymethyl-2-hydroxymuconate isomerase
MPHIVLEYSANIPPLADFAKCFVGLHKILNDMGGIKLANCKSRARVADIYFVGDGADQNAFIHLNIEFVEGRSKKQKQQIGNACLEHLTQSYKDQLSDNLQITVQVEDIVLDYYSKYPAGTLNYQSSDA